ncbi:MAG: hypothetical protein Q27BPR15_05305 [Rhodobacter sp. CACIA14H1]|nr:MAG: hypothetical protein Q27BPR15_05305 [Rhodobacter sp. CACIA14H1]
MREAIVNGSDVIRWRVLHRLKQSALAEILGVSQATVSKWESGVSSPSTAMQHRLSDVMTGVHEGRLAIELACLAPQQQIKTLVRGTSVQLLGLSAGFKQLWPETSELLGKNIRDLLVNEAAAYCNEGDYLREAVAGEILMVTGVSNRLLGVGDAVDASQRVRWHAIVRRIDGELIHEMIYEACEPDTATGFEKILRRSDVTSGFK